MKQFKLVVKSICSVLLLWTLSTGPGVAQTIIEHIGNSDPVTEGWTKVGPFVGGVVAGPITNDLGSGYDAWFVDDNSRASGSIQSYRIIPTDAQIADGNSEGWRLSGRLRVVDHNDGVDFSVNLNYDDGALLWALRFGSEADGDPIVQLYQGPIITVEGGADTYHFYELVFDPVAGNIDFFIDGIERVSNFVAPARNVPLKLVQFGGSQSSTTGHGNYNLIRFEIGVSTRPTADAGTDQTVFVGETVQLDGSSSSDPDNDPLSFNWQFISKPAGSAAMFSDPSIVNPTFVADEAGDYVIQLIVNDGSVDSDPDPVIITVQTPAEVTEDLIEEVEDLVTAGILNQGQGTALITQLNLALDALDQGNNTAAVIHLNVFINQVNAFISAGILSSAEGQPSIDAAQAIIDAIQSGLGKQVGDPVSLEQVPNEYKVFQNYPNPFNPTTTIHYELPVAGFVTLKVFDVLGKEVKTLIEGYKTEGRYEVEFDATNLPSGIYFYRLRAGEYINTKKMILMK